MSARVRKDGDGVVYETDFGSTVQRFSAPFAEMSAESIALSRKHLLDRIAKTEGELADRRAAYEKAREASEKATAKAASAYRGVESSEETLAVLNAALCDSLTSVSA